MREPMGHECEKDGAAMSEPNAWELACREACDRCARGAGIFISEGKRMHFGWTGECTAPSLLEWALQQHAELNEAQATLKEHEEEQWCFNATHVGPERLAERDKKIAHLNHVVDTQQISLGIAIDDRAALKQENLELTNRVSELTALVSQLQHSNEVQRIALESHPKRGEKGFGSTEERDRR